MSRNKKRFYAERLKRRKAREADKDGQVSFGTSGFKIKKKEVVVDTELFKMIPMYPKQKVIIDDDRRFVITEATTKAGKALPLQAILYTPTGPITMGEVKVGDSLISVEGTPTKVIGVYPQGVKEQLKITFKDGASIICSDDHLWEVETWGKISTVSTSDLYDYSESKQKRTRIPVVGVVQFEKRPYTLDPYLVGALIGDGGLSGPSVRFSSIDKFLLDKVRDCVGPHYSLKPAGGCDYRISSLKPDTVAGSLDRGVSFHKTQKDWKAYLNGKHLGSFKCKDLAIKERLAKEKLFFGGSFVPKKQRVIAQLRLMDLFGKRSFEKHIPEEYKYNTEEVRLRILQGIFDTDGYVDKHGQPRIEQTSKKLAEDITEIVESLGGTTLTTTRIGKNYTNGKEGRLVYRLGIRIKDGSKLFSLPRKVLACRLKKKPVTRTIDKIERVDAAECQCIAVEHPRRLFATSRFIMTHNTASHIEWLLCNAVNSGGGIWWWVAPVGAQSLMAFDRCKERLRGYMEQKRKRVKVGKPIPFEDNIANRTIKCNGATIVFKSADNPDSLYGEECRGAVCDEISRWKQKSWVSVYTTLTSSMGKGRLIGNVTGKRNFAHLLYLKALEEPENWGAYTLTALDAIEGGVISQGIVDQAKKDLSPQEFAMLYMAEAMEDGMNPFGHKNIQKLCQSTSFSKMKTVVFGVDFARKRDFTVVVGLDRKGSVTQMHRFQDEWDQQVAKIVKICRKVPTLVDSTGEGDVVQRWIQTRRKNGKIKGFIFTGTAKQQIMEGLALDIAKGGWTIPKDTEIEHELMDFEMDISRQGKIKYSAPWGLHDDCVCALALAREAFRQNKKSKVWWMVTKED